MTITATVANGVLYSKRKRNVREYLNNSLGGCRSDSRHTWRMKMKRHANCKNCQSDGYCVERRKYLLDMSWNGCEKWELET